MDDDETAPPPERISNATIEPLFGRECVVIHGEHGVRIAIPRNRVEAVLKRLEVAVE